MKYVNDISLSCLLSDRMVLQRGKETKIWGKSKNSEILKIDFLEQTYETVANEQGKWEVVFYNLEAGGPYDMTIKSKDNSIVINVNYSLLKSASKITSDGYIIEMAIPLKNKAEANQMMRFDVQINDAENGKRIGVNTWCDGTGLTWSTMENIGNILLVN